MVECAVQADRVTSRARPATDQKMLGLQNHYSPKYGRCFLQITYLNSGARNRPELPPLYYELWDAFEEKLLGICTDVPGYEEGAFCNIQGGQGFVKCDACRTFVRDQDDELGQSDAQRSRRQSPMSELTSVPLGWRVYWLTWLWLGIAAGAASGELVPAAR